MNPHMAYGQPQLRQDNPYFLINVKRSKLLCLANLKTLGKARTQPASTQAIRPMVSKAVPAILVPQRDPAIDSGIPDIYTAEEDENYEDKPDAWNYKFYESSAVDSTYDRST
uniref:Uncharacterized protein n=1 Tax=Romanomermis culicivorax TaxID=13658 RepID=A0A915HR42_ROMCU